METLDLLPLVAEVREVKPELAVVVIVLSPSDWEEESGLSTIIIFKSHIGISIRTYPSFELIDRARMLIWEPVFIFESQHFLLCKGCVTHLVWFDFMTLHQVAGIEIWSYLDSIRELESISAWEDVEKLVVLVEIHKSRGPLAARMIDCPLLVVPIDVILLVVLNVVIAVLRVVGVSVLALPYEIWEIGLKNRLLLVTLVDLVDHIELALDLLISLIQVAIQFELVLQVVVRGAAVAHWKREQQAGLIVPTELCWSINDTIIDYTCI